MKRDIRDRWVAALRSGKYKQCQGKLHNTESNSYCCLGVVNEVCNLNSTRIAWLDEYIKRSIDLDSIDEDILIDMNDEQGKNFNEIANWIEENL